PARRRRRPQSDRSAGTRGACSRTQTGFAPLGPALKHHTASSLESRSSVVRMSPIARSLLAGAFQPYTNMTIQAVQPCSLKFPIRCSIGGAILIIYEACSDHWHRQNSVWRVPGSRPALAGGRGGPEVSGG